MGAVWVFVPCPTCPRVRRLRRASVEAGRTLPGCRACVGRSNLRPGYSLTKEELAAAVELAAAARAPASFPTSARPGSPEKVEVMRARHEAGENIFHPGDARGVRECPAPRSPRSWEVPFHPRVWRHVL